jgi:hypothetical protein
VLHYKAGLAKLSDSEYLPVGSFDEESCLTCLDQAMEEFL